MAQEKGPDWNVFFESLRDPCKYHTIKTLIGGSDTPNGAR
jgi:hypothetical protein